MTRRRLDSELVRRGLAASKRQAEALIGEGRVTVGGRPALASRRLVAPTEPIAIEGPAPRYVSRGGEKLAPALERLGVDAVGRWCLDAGAGAGGFTDVLLEHGAAHVVAVDVGYGGLAWRLRTDPRVTVLERMNVRELVPEDLPYRPDLVVADLSFISLRAVMESLTRVAATGADLMLLVKPQFELPASAVEPGGVVWETAQWRQAIEMVAEGADRAGAGPVAVVPSSVPGPAGNVEFFLHARRDDTGRPLDLAGPLREATRLGKRATGERLTSRGDVAR